jgi:hypothetical protein
MSGTDIYRRRLLGSLGLAAAAPSSMPTPPVLADVSDSSGEHRIEAFGAKGDGQTDDSLAFQRAFAHVPAGATIRLTAGQSYRLTRSLIFTKPLTIAGGIRETTRLIFDDGSYARLGGLSAAMILPHERSSGLAAGATARRTAMTGFSMAWIGKGRSALHGILIAAPAYLSEVDVVSFPGDGFHVEAGTEAIDGNANGSSFINCSAQGNRGNGFALHGNDANACLLLGSRAFDNRGAGFYDASLLGNTYVAAEVDGNARAGFSSLKSVPNRSVFLGCYAEPNQSYDLNERNLMLGALGHMPGNISATIRALPSGDVFSNSAFVFAAGEDTTTDKVGAAMRIGDDGLTLRAGDGQQLRLTKLLSANYIDILNGDQPLIRFPSRHVAGNVTSQRPWLPSGLALGDKGQSGIVGAGARPPSGGDYSAGAIWLNDRPRPNGFVGWICVESGQPGRWHAFGRIES